MYDGSANIFARHGKRGLSALLYFLVFGMAKMPISLTNE